jgi:hypothetical protein
MLIASDLFLDVELMGDLVLGFNQIQFGDDSRVLLEACFADGEKVLDAVLSLLLDLGLVEQTFESLEDGC